MCVCGELLLLSLLYHGASNDILKYFSILYVVFVRVLFIVLCYYCWYEVSFLSLATCLMSQHVNKRELYYYHHHHHHV